MLGQLLGRRGRLGAATRSGDARRRGSILGIPLLCEGHECAHRLPRVPVGLASLPSYSPCTCISPSARKSCPRASSLVYAPSHWAAPLLRRWRSVFQSSHSTTSRSLWRGWHPLAGSGFEPGRCTSAGAERQFCFESQSRATPGVGDAGGTRRDVSAVTPDAT